MPGVLGEYWRTDYDRRVFAITGSPSVTVAAVRPDGRVKYFRANGTEVQHFSGTPTEVLLPVPRGGWTYTTGNDEIETYDDKGRLVSVWDREHLQLTLAYDSSGRLAKVTDANGRSLSFSYIGNIQTYTGEVVIVTASDKSEIRYDIDSIGNLIKVTFADGRTRQYLYENTSLKNAVTGIIDEKGVRYETIEYYAGGPAKASYLAPGLAGGTIGRNTFTYNADSTTTVIDSLGQSRIIGFTTINGVMNLASTSELCVACGTMVSSKKYDAAGYPATATDHDGNVTEYSYDDSRGLEIQRVEASNDGSARSARRIIQTDWHATFRVPIERRIRNASNILEAKSQWYYNSRGQVVARCELDPSDSAAMGYACSVTVAPPRGAKVRRWTYTYCEQPEIVAGDCPLVGLLKSINGPRSIDDPGLDGVDDLTGYSYRQKDDPTCTQVGGACTYRHGDLWKVRNALGQETEYVSHDKNGRVTRMKDANGTLTDFRYSPRGWLVDRIMHADATGAPLPPDAITHIDYDAVGNVVRVSQPDGTYLTYAYDDAHRLTDVADSLNNRIHYALDAAGNRTKEETFDSTYDPAHPGQGLKRLIARVYDQFNRLKNTLNAKGQPTLTYDSIDGYDGNGNSTHFRDGLGVQTQQQYDPLNRLITTIQDYGGADLATANTTTQYVYDSRDNLRKVTDPDNLSTAYDYDGLNSLIGLHSPDTGTSSYTYDSAGNRVTQIDARGISARYTYDALNRLTAISYPTSTLSISFQYDTANPECTAEEMSFIGRLTKMTDGSGSTSYCYDRRGNLTRKTQGTTIHTPVQGSLVAGWVTTPVIISLLGLALLYVRIRRPRAGMPLRLWGFGPWQHQPVAMIPVWWKSTGALRTFLVVLVPLGLTCDGGNSSMEQVTNLTLTTLYRYNLADRLIGLTYPSGLDVSYGRNTVGQITQVVYKTGPTAEQVTLVRSTTYLPFGPPNSVTFGNGRQLLKSYDQNYGIDQITSSGPGRLTLDFTLDVMGNIQDSSSMVGATPPTQRYKYDGLYRLKEVDNSTSTVEGYTYNKTGDRLSKASAGHAPEPYGYASPLTSHRLQSVAGELRSYDDNGNLLSGGLSYDDRNRLAGWQLKSKGTLDMMGRSVKYTYNGRGERVLKQSTTSTNETPSDWRLEGQAYSFNEGGQLLGEYQPDGKPLAEYVYLDTLPIAVSVDTEVHYIETDHLGTPRQVIDSTRNIAIWGWDFFGSAFGEQAPNQDPDGDGKKFPLNLRFPGQYFDTDTELHYNYFRDYEPGTGRYVESDPIGLKGGVSTYGYVLQRPNLYLDRLGLSTEASCPIGFIPVFVSAIQMPSNIFGEFGHWECRRKDCSGPNGCVEGCWAGWNKCLALVEIGPRSSAAIAAGLGATKFCPKEVAFILFNTPARMLDALQERLREGCENGLRICLKRCSSMKCKIPDENTE